MITAGTVTGLLAWSPVAAVADPISPKAGSTTIDPATPTQADIAAARIRASAKAFSLAGVRRELVRADADARRASVAASMAEEDYNAAAIRLERARTSAATSARAATAARARAASARDLVGRFAAASY